MTIQLTNGDSLLLSQNHGLLEWKYFYPLADNSGSFNPIGVTIQRGKLFGIEETGFGRKFPRAAEIYDFDPGDQFRFRYKNCEYSISCIQNDQYMRINSGTVSGGTYTYNTEQSSIYIVSNPGGTTVTYSPLSARTETYQDDAFFHLLPGEDYGGFVVGIPKLKTIWNNRIEIPKIQIEYNGDTCDHFSAYFETYSDFSFAEGLGKVLYQYFFTNAQSIVDSLLCFTKVADNWNSPFDTLFNPVSLGPQIINQPTIEIYPQPAGETCMLRSISGNLPNGILEIFALSGQRLFSQRIDNSSETTIPTANLPNGLYFLRTQTDSGYSQHIKMVIRH